MKLLSITLLIFACFSCKGQVNNQNNTKQNNVAMTTEKFDIETFEKNKIDGEYNFVLNDTIIKQFGGTDNYVEYLFPPPPNLFGEYKEYFYPSGKLKICMKIFPNEFDKTKKVYNKEGKLIEEINYDEPFKFSFNQLLELIKNEKDTIDIFDRKNTTIGRGSDENGTNWYITYKKVPMRREVIKIDGITGEILERSHYSHLDN